MKSPLAFDRDPLFGNLSEPLVKIDTRLTQERQRLWCWKDDDFFWFWNEDQPDFFGVFFDATERKGLRWMVNGPWFQGAARTLDTRYLRQILHGQLHHGEWARAITVQDPRSEKNGVWRVLWRRREFLLQNASTGRAVRFFPESNWGKEARQWKQLHCFSHDAAFFAEMFWPLLTERRGRLRTAFEFLELPIEEQIDPIRFGRGDRKEFLAVVGAALIVDHLQRSMSENVALRFTVRFHHRTLAPLFDFSGRMNKWHYIPQKESPRLKHLAMAFGPHLPPDFSLQSVLPSPLTLFASGFEPSIGVTVQGPFTAHEKIEAVATVRDWLSENAPELLMDWSENNKKDVFDSC